MWYVLRRAPSSAIVDCKSDRDSVEVYFSDKVGLVVIREWGVIAFCQWRRWVVNSLLPREKWLRLLELPQFRLLQLAHPWVRDCYERRLYED